MPKGNGHIAPNCYFPLPAHHTLGMSLCRLPTQTVCQNRTSFAFFYSSFWYIPAFFSFFFSFPVPSSFSPFLVFSSLFLRRLAAALPVVFPSSGWPLCSAYCIWQLLFEGDSSYPFWAPVVEERKGWRYILSGSEAV